MTFAQEEAQRLGHNHIGTEHLLLGLLRESDSVGCKVLINLGAEPAKVRSAAEFIIDSGRRPTHRELGFTAQAKTVIELAVSEARRMDHSYIGTEHLLLGLVREGEGIAFGVLESLGVSLERARTETQRLLLESPPGPVSMRPGTVSSTLFAPDPGAGLVGPDPRTRDEALTAIKIARQAVSDFSAGPLESDLVEALLLPRLTGLTEALFIYAATPFQLAHTQRRIVESMGALGTASGVLRKHGHEQVALAIDAAVTAVTRAITPEPQV